MYHQGRECFLCGRNGCGDPLDKHHIFGESNRRKSDQLGLYVYLCHDRCHIFGKHAVHNDPTVMDELHKYGQKKAMRENGWTVREFMMEFGKNYLDEDELAGVLNGDCIGGEYESVETDDMDMPF